MRRYIAVALVLAATVGLGGWSAARTAAAPGGRILTIAFHGNPNSIDPATVCSIEDLKIATHAYDRLVDFGTRRLPNGNMVVDEAKIVPRLAASWTASEDRRIYTFRLQRGVKFPSGRDVDAEAVAYSFNRSNVMGQCAKFIFTAGLLDNYESIKATDKYTVEIRLKQADPLFLHAMTTAAAGIVDPGLVEANGGVQPGRQNAWLNTHSAGSGPYVVERYIPGQEFIMTANRTYRGGAPFFQQIIYKVIPDPATRVLLLERGDVDIAYQIPYRDLARLKRNPNAQIVQNQGNVLVHIGLNVQIPPLNDRRVRQALALAAPYERIVSEVTFGFGTQMRSIVPPTMPEYTGAFWKASYDLAQARRLLEEAGHGRGVTLTLDVQAGTLEFEQVAVILQSELRKVGVNMQINKLDIAKYFEILRAFRSQMHVSARAPGVNDATYFLSYMVDCGGRFHYEQYCNPRVDQVLRQARLEPTRHRRNVFVREIQRLHNEDYPMIFLYSEDYVLPMRRDIEGYVYNPNRSDEFYATRRK